LAWFEAGDRKVPIACTGVYCIPIVHPDTTELAWQCDIHGYFNDKLNITSISGTPLLEIQSGKGRLLASELWFESGNSDPIARRLLMNAIHSLFY
jgi:hypothetical protein